MKVYAYNIFSKRLENEYVAKAIIYGGILLNNYAHVYFDKFGRKQSYFHQHLSLKKLSDRDLEILHRGI